MKFLNCPFSGLRVSDIIIEHYYSETVRPDEPVIIAGIAIMALEVDAVVIHCPYRGFHGVLTGSDFLNHIINQPEEAWKTLYLTHCYEIDSKSLETDTSEALPTLLSKMRRKGRGYAVVPNHAKTPRVIGLTNILKYISRIVRQIGVQVQELATHRPVSLDRDAKIIELIKIMQNKGVRRVLIEDKVATDRDIVRFLLEDAIDDLKREPCKVFQRSVNEILDNLSRPAILRPHDDASRAIKALSMNPSYTGVTTGREAIITPWDLTVKLCGKLCQLETLIKKKTTPNN